MQMHVPSKVFLRCSVSSLSHNHEAFAQLRISMLSHNPHYVDSSHCPLTGHEPTNGQQFHTFCVRPAPPPQWKHQISFKLLETVESCCAPEALVED